jgi:putative transposase
MLGPELRRERVLRRRRVDGASARLGRTQTDSALQCFTVVAAARVSAFLTQMIDLYGRPNAIRCGNGPELTSQTFTDWCKDQDIALRFIQPGKPAQNAYIERFNGAYRAEVLSAYRFDSLDEVREIAAEWLERYNESRPHDALGSLPAARYRERLLAAEAPV